LVDVSGVYFSFADFLNLAGESMLAPLNKFQGRRYDSVFITNRHFIAAMPTLCRAAPIGEKSFAMSGQRWHNRIAHGFNCGF
jgi:hypothetical protein